MIHDVLATLAALDTPRWLDDGQQCLGAAGFVGRVRERAGQLRAGGDVTGQRTIITASGSADFLVELVAVWAAGGIACPVDAGTDPDALRAVRALLDRVPPDHRPGARAESTVLLTSGSTGARKGVRLSTAALLGNARAAVRRLDLGRDDHLMINIPFHFTSAICHFLACLVSGARLTAIAQPLLARDLVERVRAMAPTAFGGAPLQARWLGEGLDAATSLRWIMTSGDDLPVSTRELLARNLPGCRQHVFYGLTEVAGRLASLHPDDRPRAAGSVGRPIEGLAVEVLDEQGQPTQPGQLGEVHASGSWLMIGYIGQPDLPAVAGRFPTGDIGWLDADGHLYLAGRSDDVFKVSGTKVSGLAVREGILRTGLVADAFVFPARIRNGTIVAAALVVPLPQQSLALGPLRAALRGGTASHELPREFIVVPELPRTGSGKPDRPAIDRLLAARGWQREHERGVHVRVAADG